MPCLAYFRPETIEEALPLLEKAQPIAGGTDVVPRRGGLTAVVDLQALGLDKLSASKQGLVIGAMVRLQRLVETADGIPEALSRAARLEAGLNLRNMQTVAGTVMASDGRSPLTTVLLALGGQVEIQPGGEVISLETLLARRARSMTGRMIVALRFPPAHLVLYEQVARAPADLPLVCAAVACRDTGRKRVAWSIALGGYGTHPLRLKEAEAALGSGKAPEHAAEAARVAFANAGDQWASAEYRSAVAGILVRRLVAEARGR